MVELMPMTANDIAEALALWCGSTGICLSESDKPEALMHYLERNPGCSCVARVEGQLVGVALAGHDGRRGYLHHVVVREGFRRRGIAKSIVQHCLAAFQERGLLKCNLFVETGNKGGFAFWNHMGWEIRPELLMMSRKLGT